MFDCPSFNIDGPLIQHVYFNLLTVVAIISPILFIYTAFCLIYLSPKMMKTYRWYLLGHQITAELVCFGLHTGGRPLLFTPTSVFGVTGFVNYIMPVRYVFPVGIVLEVANIATLTQLFAYRYWTISEIMPSARKFNYFHQLLTVYICSMGPLLFFLILYCDYLKPTATEMLISNYSCLKELTKLPVELHGYDKSVYNTYFLLPLVLIISTGFMLLAYNVCINWRAINIKSMSPQLRRLHRNYIIQLALQSLMPALIILFPIVFDIIIVYQEIWSHEFLANVSMLCLSTFSIIDSVVLLSMNKPYHNWFFKKLEEYKKRRSPTVASQPENLPPIE